MGRARDLYGALYGRDGGERVSESVSK
jgi:hypothetical protein